MKKITLLIALMITSLGFSQNLLLGMETGETGGVNGGPFGAMAAPVLEAGTGTNTSRVLKIVGNTAGEVWQGINLNLTTPVVLTTTKTMTIDVLSATPITFLVKVNGGLLGATEAAAVVTHNGDNKWQKLSFTFNTSLDGKAETANGVYQSFVIHAYWKTGQTSFFPNVVKDARTFYVDNITGVAPDPIPAGTPKISFTIPSKSFGDAPFSLLSLVSSDSPGDITFTSSNPSVANISGITLTILSAGTSTITATQAASAPYIAGSKTASLIVSNPDPVPTTAAPVPPNRNAVDVKSFFSNKYTNMPIDTWTPSWSSSEVTDVQIAGDDTKKILFSDVLGIDFSSAGKHQDLTSMTHFHMDYWTSNPNPNNTCVFNVKLADFGGTAEEYTSMLLAMNSATNPKLESGKWVSVDLPLTAFTAGNSKQIRTDIARLLLFSNLNAVYEADIAQPFGVVIRGALITDKAKVYVDNIYLYKGTALATEKFETSNVKMYPNPVKNTLTIEANSTIDKIAVYSILGQEVISKSPKSSSTTLQTSTLQKGTYIVKSTIDGKTATSKFIKE